MIHSRGSAAITYDPFSKPWLGPMRSTLIADWLQWTARRSNEREGTRDDEDEDPHGVSASVVALTFLAPPDEQWSFIVELIDAAPARDDLFASIAAGPLEGLLGRFGEVVIDRVEALATTSVRFRELLRGVWRHAMSDEVWERVCKARG